MRYDLYVTFLDGLPIHAHPPEEVGRFMDDARECAKGRQRSQSGPEAAAWFERGRRRLHGSYQPRGCCTNGGDIWGSRSTWQRLVLRVVQRMPTHGIRDCITAPAQKQTKHQPLVHVTSRLLNGCLSAIKWKPVGP